MKMNVKKRSKKAQVAVFVIIAVVFVIILLLVFLGRDKLKVIITKETPVGQIKKCMKEAGREALEILTLQGGSIEPENYYLYEGNKVDYLCYAENSYEKCVMQKPLLKQSIEAEIEDYIQPRVESCVKAVRSSLQKKGYSVSYKNVEPKVELLPSNILIKLKELNLVIEKETTESYFSLTTNIYSKLYDLVVIASDIANWEVSVGKSDAIIYMTKYPWLKIERKPQEDATIYILTHLKSGDKFIFATKSWIVPPGLIEE